MKPQKFSKLDYLEGLRGVAAFIVVLHHLRLTFCPSLTDNIFSYLLSATNSSIVARLGKDIASGLLNGSMAVGIFWFMSAYVISIKLFDQNPAESRKYLISSTSKRYFRLIVPITASVFLAYVLLSFRMMRNLQLALLFHNTWLGEMYTFEPHLITAVKSSLWDTLFSYNATTTYNSSLWTMSFELFGSFLCFAVFAIFGKWRKRYFVYIPTTILLILMGHGHRFWRGIFMSGFMLSDLDYSNNNKETDNIDRTTTSFDWGKWLLIPVLLLVSESETERTGILFTVLGILIVFIVTRSRFWQAFFQHRLFVWLGKISFSLYLIHIPVICSLSCYLYLSMTLPFGYKVLIISILTLAVLLVLSALFTKYVDGYAIKLSNKIGKFFVREAESKSIFSKYWIR